MSFDYSQFFQEYYDSMMLPYTLLSNSIGSLLSIAMYVLTALGLYTIAKRRGINKPWLAWIPVVNCWVVGCISDQYRYVVKGQTKSKRKALLTLSIIQMILVVAIVVAACVAVFGIVGDAINGADGYQMVEKMLPALIAILVLCLPMVGIAIAYAVVYYMAMYDVYASCDPQNHVVFLVLSILFNVTEPFFVFFLRKKDGGMPPRREPQPQACIPGEPPKEPWETTNE